MSIILDIRKRFGCAAPGPDLNFVLLTGVKSAEVAYVSDEEEQQGEEFSFPQQSV